MIRRCCREIGGTCTFGFVGTRTFMNGCRHTTEFCSHSYTAFTRTTTAVATESKRHIRLIHCATLQQPKSTRVVQSQQESCTIRTTLRSSSLRNQHSKPLSYRSSERSLSISATAKFEKEGDNTATRTPATQQHSSLVIAPGDPFWTDLENAAQWQPSKRLWNPTICHAIVERYDTYLQRLMDEFNRKNNNNTDLAATITKERLLVSETVTLAVKCLCKSHYIRKKKTVDGIHATATNEVVGVDRYNAITELSETIRRWENTLGILGKTQLTDHLSLRLLTANAKAGNVGRVIALLRLRQARQYKPRLREFLFAISAIQVAASVAGTGAGAANPNNRNVRLLRNIFVNDVNQPAIDNPTRWLDAILLNMKQREFPLNDINLVNKMLLCYAPSNGPSGKAVHHFYRVVRQPVLWQSSDNNYNDTSIHDSMPKGWFYIPESNTNDILNNSSNEEYADNDYVSEDDESSNTNVDSTHIDVRTKKRHGRHVYRPIKVQLRYSSEPPPFYKIPSQVKGKLLFRTNETSNNPTATSSNVPRGQYRIEREMDPDFSVPLTAAFAFAESIQQGACGHEPIKFNTASYNALIKACVQRGSLWRAMHVLDHQMMDGNDDTRPNIISYNLLLAGLARVGDVATAQEYVYKLLNAGLRPDAFTVRAITDGLLNAGDISGAITVTQDFFNQHNVLPPYTQHLKILEVCLASDLTYEAKRYCYFIQQLWHWKPSQYHTNQFKNRMQRTQRNPQLQKSALKKLFAYFGVILNESDFL